MAFLRFNRDKRGYEHFYLVEATTNRRGKTRARVLYWFRTPPNVKIGREPFDEEVRQALESQNPGVVFDWRRIKETPIPSADAERWRERRRAERAEKAARRARTAETASAEPGSPEVNEPLAARAPFEPDEPFEPHEPGEPLEPDEPGEPGEPDLEYAALDAAEQQADQLALTEDSLVLESATIDTDAPAGAGGSAVPGAAPRSSRRRRRRRRRGRRPIESQAVATSREPGEPVEPREPGEPAEPGKPRGPGEPGEPREPGD